MICLRFAAGGHCSLVLFFVIVLTLDFPGYLFPTNQTSCLMTNINQRNAAHNRYKNLSISISLSLSRSSSSLSSIYSISNFSSMFVSDGLPLCADALWHFSSAWFLLWRHTAQLLAKHRSAGTPTFLCANTLDVENRAIAAGKISASTQWDTNHAAKHK